MTARRSDAVLSTQQRAYLTEQATTGALLRKAVETAVAVPALLFFIGLALTGALLKVPVIGWLLALYGLILTVGLAAVGIVAIPVVLPLAVVGLLTARRGKLRRDVESGTAARYAGAFAVKERGNGAVLVADDFKQALKKSEYEALKPAVRTEGDQPTLEGSVVKATNSGLFLGVYDPAGRPLVSRAADS